MPSLPKLPHNLSISFLPENRRQKLLLLVFGGLVAGGVGLAVWYRFLWEPALSLPSAQPPPPRTLEIDFSPFQHPGFLELGQPRPPILPPEEVGKRNPFTPSE